MRILKRVFKSKNNFYDLNFGTVVYNNLIFIKYLFLSLIILPILLWLIFIPIMYIVPDGFFNSNTKFLIGYLCSFGLIIEIPLVAFILAIFNIKLSGDSINKNILSHLYSLIYIIPLICDAVVYNMISIKDRIFYLIPVVLTIIIPILRYKYISNKVESV